MGKPVILGTRIPVELILRKLSEKARRRRICWFCGKHTRSLQPEDIQASPLFVLLQHTIAHEEDSDHFQESFLRAPGMRFLC